MPINKIDSNATGLSFAEESTLKTLPGVGGADAVWYGLEPNGYADFGGEISTTSRSPINPSRQNQKGAVTDLNASGGFNVDLTQNNLIRLMQGFFFADARELPSTKPLNGTQITVSAVDSATKTYTIVSGGTAFVAGHLIFSRDFSINGNNGLKSVASSTETTVVVNESVVDESSPPANAKFDTVGFEFAVSDIDISVTDGIPSIDSTLTDFTELTGLFEGKWIFIGDDNSSNSFVNNVGFARIKTITANKISFDDTSFTPVNEVGTGKSIRIFCGTSIKNEKDVSLIKRRSYNIERTLGTGETATQAEYLEGAVPNEFTLNIPQSDKFNVDCNFVACDNTHRSGEVGDEIKAGLRVLSLGEDAYNTTSDIYRIKMSVLDPNSSNPEALFAYVTEASISINNNISPNKAIGVLGAFDVSAGNFEIGGSSTVYFTTIAAIQAVRNNSDVALSIISTARNAGFIFDIPLLSLGGGRLSVEKDAPISIPLESSGAENDNGYTLLFDNFKYLPTIAMP